MAAKGHNAARTLQAALLAGLAAIAWQPATVHADAQSSGVETAGWHAAGSRRTPLNRSANYGEIQQVTYLEPVTTPSDLNTSSSTSLSPSGTSQQLRWKARPIKHAAVESLPVKLTSATEPCSSKSQFNSKSQFRSKSQGKSAMRTKPAADCKSTGAEETPAPVASISSDKAKRYNWGKLGFDPWGDLGLGSANSKDEEQADSQAKSDEQEIVTPEEIEEGLASLSTVRQADSELPVDPGDEAPKAKSVPPLALPNGGPDDAEDGEPRTAQRRTLPSMPQMPNFEEAFAQGPQSREVDCDRERQKLKPINAITNKISAEPGDFPPECNLGDPPYKPRCYPEMVYAWKASNLCHKPLYFEQPAVERYGHALPPILQPLASGAHFFVDVAMLPYHMGLELPQECVYALGYYRPGDCAPMHIDGFPISARAAVFQAGAILSGTAIFGSFTAF